MKVGQLPMHPGRIRVLGQGAFQFGHGIRRPPQKIEYGAPLNLRPTASIGRIGLVDTPS